MPDIVPMIHNTIQLMEYGMKEILSSEESNLVMRPTEWQNLEVMNYQGCGIFIVPP
jgi:hypothetical protein